MTNEMIIFKESLILLENGIINGTGKYINMKTDDGRIITVEVPEDIHTYSAWKMRGRQVKRGEKCKAAFTIWKAGKAKKLNEDDETFDSENAKIKMFMKQAFFFTFDQTEPCKV